MNIWNTRVELTSICEINIHILLREYNPHWILKSVVRLACDPILNFYSSSIKIKDRKVSRYEKHFKKS